MWYITIGIIIGILYILKYIITIFSKKMRIQFIETFKDVDSAWLNELCNNYDNLNQKNYGNIDIPSFIASYIIGVIISIIIGVCNIIMWPITILYFSIKYFIFNKIKNNKL